MATIDPLFNGLKIGGRRDDRGLPFPVRYDPQLCCTSIPALGTCYSSVDMAMAAYANARAQQMQMGAIILPTPQAKRVWRCPTIREGERKPDWQVPTVAELQPSWWDRKPSLRVRMMMRFQNAARAVHAKYADR